jgi:hypothetical protein
LAGQDRSSLQELKDAIHRFLDDTNANPKPFTWTKDPNKIIAAAKRGSTRSPHARPALSLKLDRDPILMPRRWIIALSLAWGLASGCVAALVTAVGLLAVGWVYLYGDDPWPAYFSERLVPIAAGAAGLFGLAIPGAVIALTRRSLPGLEGRLRTSSGLRWGFLVVPLLILGALLWAIQHQDVARERAAAEAERMIHRQEQMHRLETARWDLDPAAGRLRIELAAQGTTAGSYTLCPGRLVPRALRGPLAWAQQAIRCRRARRL